MVEDMQFPITAEKHEHVERGVICAIDNILKLPRNATLTQVQTVTIKSHKGTRTKKSRPVNTERLESRVDGKLSLHGCYYLYFVIEITDAGWLN
jgi:hypothetical protein